MVKYGIAALAVALLVCAYLAGQRAIKAEWKAEREGLEYQLRESIRSQTRTVQEAENALTELEQVHEDVVAKLRSGELRLRQCARRSPVQTPPSTGDAPAAPDTGFTIADAEAALRIAADGDRAIVERNACIKLLIQ